MLERFDPSITRMLLTVNLTEAAYSRIESRSSPGSKGANLLNRGMIHVGAMNWIASDTIVTATHAYSQARSPAYSKNAKIAAMRGAPSTIASPSAFTLSSTNVLHVVLLNPNWASMTNVL